MENNQDIISQDMAQEESTPIKDFFFGSKEYRKAIQAEYDARKAVANTLQTQSDLQNQQLQFLTNEFQTMKQQQNKSKVWQTILGSIEDGNPGHINHLIADPSLAPAFKNLGVSSVETFDPNNKQHLEAYAAAGIPKEVFDFLQENLRYSREVNAGLTPYVKNYGYVSEYGNVNSSDSGYLNNEDLNKFVQSLGVAYPLYRDAEGKLKAGQLQDLIAASGAAVSEYNNANRTKVLDFIANTTNSIKGIYASTQEATSKEAALKNQKTQQELNLTEQLTNEILSKEPNAGKIKQLQDAILAIQGKGTTATKPGELQSLINTYLDLGYSAADAEKLAQRDYNIRFGKPVSGLQKDIEAVSGYLGSTGQAAELVISNKFDTPKERENKYITKVTNNIDNIVAPGKLSVLATQPNNANYYTVATHIRDLSNALNFKPTEFLTKEISDLSSFTNYATKLSTLGIKDTGIITNLKNNILPYINDHVNSDASKAFKQYSIKLGNQMFGATYTPGEMAKYIEGFGSLSQNSNEVKKSAKVYLEGLIEQAKGMKSAFPDERLFNWYMQPRIDQLQSALTKLDTSKSTKVMGPSKNTLEVGATYNGKTISKIVTSTDGRTGLIFTDGSKEIVK